MSWIQTYTGKKFYPFSPNPEHIDIEDIAHSLSLTCRFRGHCKRFYSVAEHSWFIYQEAKKADTSRGDQMWALLHDAAEAYCSDLLTPIKLEMGAFRELENGILKAVAVRFGLVLPMPEMIKELDLRMLATERRQAMGQGPTWDNLSAVLPLKIELIFLSSEAAKYWFLRSFDEIESEKHSPDDKPKRLKREFSHSVHLIGN